MVVSLHYEFDKIFLREEDKICNEGTGQDIAAKLNGRMEEKN